MNHRPLESIATDPKRRFLCRHIFTDGHRCGSPALRGESLCYHHVRTRRRGIAAGRSGIFVLPHADDRASIQLAIADVLCRLAAGDIDFKRGGILLYGLQVASTNLGRPSAAQPEAQPQVDDFTEDYHLGDLAPIAEVPIEKPVAIQNQATPPQPSQTAEESPNSIARDSIGHDSLGRDSIGRDFSPDIPNIPDIPDIPNNADITTNPGFSPEDTLSSRSTPLHCETPVTRCVGNDSAPAFDTASTIPEECATPTAQYDNDDHPELAAAEPSTHLPRPTRSELLRRRKPAYVHNATEKDYYLYPAIREELIFTPTPEELAEPELAISA